jgi:hypothetical protein
MKNPRDTFRAKWRRFRQLPPEDRALVRRAMFLMPFTMAGLRLIGFRRLKGLFDRFSSASSSKKRALSEIPGKKHLAARIVRAARSAELNGIGQPSCLERSLALWCLLRRNGIDAELQIGVQTGQTEFAAHAWVEWNGEVLNDSPDVRKDYVRFEPSIGSAKLNSR